MNLPINYTYNSYPKEEPKLYSSFFEDVDHIDSGTLTLSQCYHGLNLTGQPVMSIYFNPIKFTMEIYDKDNKIIYQKTEIRDTPRNQFCISSDGKYKAVALTFDIPAIKNPGKIVFTVPSLSTGKYAETFIRTDSAYIYGNLSVMYTHSPNIYNSVKEELAKDLEEHNVFGVSII